MLKAISVPHDWSLGALGPPGMWYPSHAIPLNRGPVLTLMGTYQGRPSLVADSQAICMGYAIKAQIHGHFPFTRVAGGDKLVSCGSSATRSNPFGASSFNVGALGPCAVFIQSNGQGKKPHHVLPAPKTALG